MPPSPPSNPAETLEPLLPILNAFVHRHKNQHGASHWFRYVPILRRSLRSFVEASSIATTANSSKSAAARETRLQRHANWLHDRVVPRCFLAFSQLAADNQHAPIGLLLLALLARVNAVLQVILTPSAQHALFPSKTTTILDKPQPKGSEDILRSQPASTTVADQPDRGTVIARHLALSTSKTYTPESTSQKPPPKAAQPRREQEEHEPRREQHQDDRILPKATDAFVEKRAEDKECDKKIKDKTKKKEKKKKKKAVDAFSDMFGGL